MAGRRDATAKTAWAVPFIALGLCSCTVHDGTFTVINRSSEPISRVVVTACGQMIEAHAIAVGGKAEGSYKLTCEGEPDIVVLFRSGRAMQAPIGYVTTGIDIRHEITVTEAGIEIWCRGR
jgi:hypothetical protein